MQLSTGALKIVHCTISAVTQQKPNYLTKILRETYKEIATIHPIPNNIQYKWTLIASKARHSHHTTMLHVHRVESK